METLLNFLNLKMKTPVAYTSFETSWFHYLSLLLMIIGILIFTKLFKRTSSTTLKQILLVVGLLMIVLEIYKQIIYTYEAKDYQWYAFPFQFCSTPMYLYVLYGLTKNQKLETHLLAFLSTYGTFAGLAVMFYPSTVFIDTIGINIQTMVHHGFMAIIGVSLLLSKPLFSLRTMVNALKVFLMLVVIAISLNLLFNQFVHDGAFNMFFINPNFDNQLPILSLLDPYLPHPIFVLVYIIGFSFVSYLTLLLVSFILNIFKTITDTFIEKQSK
ncbi:MAG: YwaF family protein [Acholeplasma sp.]|nr:YwaF family protein [Acholeplasma sp.]